MYRTTREGQNIRVWVVVWLTGAVHLWAVLIVADTQQQVPGDIYEIPEDWMVDDLTTTLNYLLDGTRTWRTQLPFTWTETINKVLYDVTKTAGNPLHMAAIDRRYRLAATGELSPASWPSPARFVRRLKVLVEYFQSPLDELTPEGLRQRIEDLGDHPNVDVCLVSRPVRDPVPDFLHNRTD